MSDGVRRSGDAGTVAALTEVRLITPAFLALATATLAFFVAAGIVLPASPTYAEGPLGATQTQVGIAMASFSIAALLMRPVVGWATDRFGRRPLLIGGALITVAALLLHVLATTLPVFIAARSLLGVGEGFFFVAALAAGSDLAPPSRRGEALSFLSLSLYLGIAIGPLVGEVFLRSGGYIAVWLVAAAIAGGAFCLTLVTPETSPTRLSPGAPRPKARILHPAGIFPGLLILAGLWGMAGFLSFLPLYVKQIGLDSAAVPLAIYALIVVGLRVVGAKLPDRLGAVRLSGTAMLISGAGLVIMAVIATPVGLLTGTAVFATGVAFTMPALLTLAVSRVPPEERGTVTGTTTVFLDVVFGFAPVVLGQVIERAGYAEMFLLSAGLSFLASAVLVVRRASVAATWHD